MNQFIDEFDMIARWPKKPVDKKKVISWLAEKFEFDGLKSLKFLILQNSEFSQSVTKLAVINLKLNL